MLNYIKFKIYYIKFFKSFFFAKNARISAKAGVGSDGPHEEAGLRAADNINLGEALRAAGSQPLMSTIYYDLYRSTSKIHSSQMGAAPVGIR